MTKKIKVEKVTADDFEQVYPLFKGFNNPDISRDEWKNLFTHQWNNKENYLGYKLVDGNQAVGFVGYIFSERMIRGRLEKFCNISSWIVKKEYRHLSIQLLFPLRELNDCTVTSFTPGVTPYKAPTKLFAFKLLDHHETILPILPLAPSILKKRCKIIANSPNQPQKIVEFLPDYEKQIFRDHANFDCNHLVVATNQGQSYMIFKKVYRRHLPFAKLYYSGDLDLFLTHLKELRLRIPLVLKTIGLVIDSRFTQNNRFHFSKNKAFFMPMAYRSKRLQPHEIDYLYSEFFLLGL